MHRIVVTAALLASSGLYAQQMKTYVVAQRRAGVIEFMDPATLATVSQIHFDVGPQTVGLNGVSASSDGTRLYVDGPTTGNPKGCCNLYSIELATLQAKKVADIWGTKSREALFLSNGIMYQANEIFVRGGPETGSQQYLDQNHHFLFRLAGYDHPALDLYDLTQGTRVRRLVPPLAPAEIDGQWNTSGVWSGDRFFLYRRGYDHSTAAQLWAVSTTASELGPGVAVEPFAQSPGCPHEAGVKEIITAGGNLFVYEMFGTKLDRRDRCGSSIPGGAWIVDPDTGRLLQQIAPKLHFAHLIADPTEPMLYGVATEGGSSWKAPITLVRIDARSGLVLQSRNLDQDFWWIAVAQLQNSPTGEVQVVP